MKINQKVKARARAETQADWFEADWFEHDLDMVTVKQW